MSRVCEFTGKRPMTGHNVSHAKNRTNRIFRPNLCNVTLLSDKLGRSFKFRISAHALRSVDHVGGLDAYLTKVKEDQLSASARKVKREIANAS